MYSQAGSQNKSSDFHIMFQVFQVEKKPIRLLVNFIRINIRINIRSNNVRI